MLQAEAREAQSKKQAEEAAAKLQSAAEARQRLAAERKTLQEAQATLDAALLEVSRLCLARTCPGTRIVSQLCLHAHQVLLPVEPPMHAIFASPADM